MAEPETKSGPLDTANTQSESDVTPAKDGIDDEAHTRLEDEGRASPPDYFVPKAQRKRKLPAWLNHFTGRELKLLAKASAAVWIMTILIFIDPARQAIGQATFFGSIILFFVPPVGVVFVHMLGGLTVIIGACLGWAWGTITMEAALATRPAADLAARYQELQQLADQSLPNASPSASKAYVSNAIGNGYMLDPRVTATYFCMMGLFVYLVARIRVAAPKLTMVSIFALVVSDVYLTSAPLLPSFNGTLPALFIYPVGTALAIGFVCNILIFPQSTSSIVRDGIRDTLTPMKGFSEAILYHLANPTSRITLESIAEVQAVVIGAFQSTEASRKFLAMDFTTGRWSPEDIASLSAPTREAVVAFSQLVQYQKQREEHRIKKDNLAKFTEGLEGDEQEKRRLKVGHHQISRAISLYENMQHPDSQKLIEETLTMLAKPSKTLLGHVNAGIDAVNEALAYSNRRKQRVDLVKDHNSTLEDLKTAQSDFMETINQSILVPYSDLFDAEGYLIQSVDDVGPPPISGLVVGMLFQESINNLTKAVASLLQRTTELEQKRSGRHFWSPRGLRRIFAWSLDQDAVPSAVQNPAGLRRSTTEPQERSKRHRREKRHSENDSQAAERTAEEKLSAMRKPMSRQRHATSKLLVGVIQWLTNAEGLYALRVLVITVALTLPAAIPSSSAFYRQESGLWAAIMGQLGVVPYTADFVYGSLLRTAGTIAGGVLGMLCWYIGAGSGPGNAYGMAAIMAVAIVCFMWLRLFQDAKHLQTIVIMVATTYLVVSYSWTDARNPPSGNVGIGYMVFWRRLILVFVGMGAAAFVTFFPRPPSSSRHCRHVLSDCLGSIKDRYTLFVSTWKTPPTDLRSVIERETINSEEVLAGISPQIKQLQFEFSTSSFDSHALDKISHLCIEMSRNLTRMLLCLPSLEPASRAIFMENSGAGEEIIVMELVAVLTLLQQVLISGDPLPALMSTPLFQRSMTFLGHDKKEERVLQMARSQLVDDTGRKYVAAVSAFIHFLFCIEELVIEVKKAVGETGDVDIEK